MGDKSLWRKADIIADATMGIIAQPATFSGNMLIDDTFLLGGGFTPDDLVQYVSSWRVVGCRRSICY
jgi:hypothetical protein